MKAVTIAELDVLAEAIGDVAVQRQNHDKAPSTGQICNYTLEIASEGTDIGKKVCHFSLALGISALANFSPTVICAEQGPGNSQLRFTFLWKGMVI